MNKDELFELNANNEALITLLDDSINRISMSKGNLKAYEFNRLNEALSYISGQLFDNTTKIESLINGGTK